MPVASRSKNTMDTKMQITSKLLSYRESVDLPSERCIKTGTF
jgi:hypothetical protein